MVSRPLQKWIVSSQSHMFVVVVDDKTGVITRFSYGPGSESGKLVSITGTNNTTDNTDRAAMKRFLADPLSAYKSGIKAALINASDEAVKSSGRAIDQALGTDSNPGENAPDYSYLPSGDKANSNSAIQALSTRAVQSENPEATQAQPRGTSNPGTNQHGNVPTREKVTCTGSRAKRDSC